MATYQEINSSEQANFNYWTDRAKFLLCVYKERKELQMHKAYVNQARVAFRQAMSNRSKKEFLKKA